MISVSVQGKSAIHLQQDTRAKFPGGMVFCQKVELLQLIIGMAYRGSVPPSVCIVYQLHLSFVYRQTKSGKPVPPFVCFHVHAQGSVCFVLKTMVA